MAENEIGDYRCPDCQGEDISFIEIRDIFNSPKLPRQMAVFFCRCCRKKFEVESRTYIYQVSLVNALREKYRE